MDETTRQIVMAAVLPAALGAVAGALPARADAPRAATRAMLATVLAAAAPIAAMLVLFGAPHEKWQAVLWLPAAGAIAATVRDGTPRRAWLDAALVVALAAATAWIAAPVTDGEAPWVRALPALGVVALAAALAPLAAARGAGVAAIALGLGLGGAAGVALATGFLKLALVVAAAGVPIGVAGLVLAARRVRARWSVALLAAPMLALAPLEARLYLFDDVRWIAFALPALAPLVALAALTRRSARLEAAALALVAIVAAAGAGVARLPAGDESADDPTADMYRQMLGE